MEATEQADVDMAEAMPTDARIRRAAANGTSDDTRAEARRRALAQFVRTGMLPHGSGLVAGLAGRLPVLVYQAVHQSGLRTPFPLVFDAASERPVSLGAFVDRLVEGLDAEGEDLDLCRHFAGRVEGALRSDRLPDLPLKDAWKSACAAIKSELRATRTEAFAAFEKRTLQGLPRDGKLLPCEAASITTVASAVIARRTASRAGALLAEAEVLRTSLGALLDVEREEGAVQPDTLRKTVGGALNDAFDFDALSHLLEAAPHAAGLDPERRGRIEALVDVLSGGPALFTPLSASSIAEAEAAMNTVLEGFVAFLKALEAARLEAANRYRPEVHDAVFEAYRPEALSSGDLASCPPLFVTLDAADLPQAESESLLSLMSGPYPYVLMLIVGDDTSPATQLLPVAAIGLGTCAVAQCVLSDVEGWTSGLDALMDRSGPRLLAVHAGASSNPHPYIAAAVARDGRAVPTFVFNPARGTPWADRLQVDGNEAADADWPRGRMTFTSPAGTVEERDIAFTWLDYAATVPAHDVSFVALSRADEVEGLVAAELYLGLTESERGAVLPVIWTVTEDGLLEQAVVTFRLVEGAETALDRWRRLQELGGIRNSWAVRAEEAARVRFAAERDEAIEAVRREHAAEMDRAVGSLAESIVSNIAAGLLDMESGAPATPRVSTPVTPKKPAPVAAPTSDAEIEPGKPSPAEPEEEAISLDEAYIETPRCTACNECTQLNPMMFAYNAEKQAYIKDATAGPYRDLVMAAEKCPVRIIHPGKPANPSEQGLEDLLDRAKAFL